MPLLLIWEGFFMSIEQKNLERLEANQGLILDTKSPPISLNYVKLFEGF